MKRGSVEDGAALLLDEPHLGLFLGDALELAHAVVPCATASDAGTGAAEDDVEVHAENTCGGIVLDSEIDVFVNAEAEVA